MAQIITYGLGGYDPEKPNNNIVEVIELPDEPQEEVAAK
jgi:ribosomal protein L1